MVMFFAGMILALVLEWVVYTFWWKPRRSTSGQGGVVMTQSEVQQCEKERITLQNSVQGKTREISHLQARIAMLEETQDRYARQKASEEKTRSEAPEVSPEKLTVAVVTEAPQAEVAPLDVASATTEQAPVAVAKKAPAKRQSADKKPAATVVVPEPQPDQKSLEKIAGIGPKLAEALMQQGLINAALIADADEARLQAAVQAAGARYAKTDISSWAVQARLVVAGDIAALKEFQSGLKK